MTRRKNPRINWLFFTVIIRLDAAIFIDDACAKNSQWSRLSISWGFRTKFQRVCFLLILQDQPSNSAKLAQNTEQRMKTTGFFFLSFKFFFLFSFFFFFLSFNFFFKFFFSLLYQTPKHHKHISHIAPDHWEGVFWNHPGCSPHTGWSRFTDDIRRFTHLPGYAWLDTLMLQHRYFCLCPLQAYMDRVFEMRI